MSEFLFLMHDDAPSGRERAADWPAYLAKLEQAGSLRGGSVIGDGRCLRKNAVAATLSTALTGFIRIDAPTLAAALELVPGNPTYEAGGTVEVRELPKSA